MSQDAHNLLRPESVETFYILWKASGDPRYKQWAWQVRCTALCYAALCRAELCCAVPAVHLACRPLPLGAVGLSKPFGLQAVAPGGAHRLHCLRHSPDLLPTHAC